MGWGWLCRAAPGGGISEWARPGRGRGTLGQELDLTFSPRENVYYHASHFTGQFKG